MRSRGARRRPTSASSSAATARSSTRCAATPDTGVPGLRVNFGTLGFLAAVERDELDEGLARAFAGEFEVVDLPGLEVEVEGGGRWRSTTSPSPGARTAGSPSSPTGSADEEIGHVRCDGLVAATPAGPPATTSPTGPDPGLGGGGLRRQLHRPAHADRAGAGRRAGRRAPRRQRGRPRAGRHRARRRPGRRARRRGGARGPLPRRRSAGSPSCPGTSFYQRMREKFGRLATESRG